MPSPPPLPLRTVQSYLVFDGVQSPGRQRIDGNLTWYDILEDGSVAENGSWPANSGSRDLLPTPNGVWRVSNFRDRYVSEGDVGFVRDDVGFSLDITPDPAFGRRYLRIHPDGGLPGTAGCIGLTCGATQLNGFSTQVQNYLRNNNSMVMIVRGSYTSLENVIIRTR